MHRTLKAETTRPAAGNRTAQQKRFNGFHREFSHKRPHEAIGMNTPASRYQPSPKHRPGPQPIPTGLISCGSPIPSGSAPEPTPPLACAHPRRQTAPKPSASGR
ncbi:MAG: hypothetical protein ACREF9_04015 [Opitutaceae bacterium]